MTGISLVTRLVRTLGVSAGLAASALTVVGLPAAAVIGAWRATYAGLGGQLPIVSDLLPHDTPRLVAESVLLSWEGAALPPPPTWGTAIELSAQLPLILAGALLLINAGIPMGARIKNATGLSPMRVGRDSPLQSVVNELRRQSRGPAARLWLTPGHGIQALALSGPLHGHAIVLSEGVVKDLPAAMIKWIIAHEYAHILHGDTRSGSLWVLGMRSVYLFERIRTAVAHLVLRLIAELPLLRILFLPCLAIVKGMNLVARLGRWVGARVFLVFDRWAGRRMEFAADRYAASMVGPGPGIDLFAALAGELEPRYGGLFATHPPLHARIARLKKNPAGWRG